MENIILQMKKKFESLAIEAIVNEQEKGNIKPNSPIALFKKLIEYFKAQINEFDELDPDAVYGPDNYVILNTVKSMVSEYHFKIIHNNTPASQLNYAIGLYAASELEFQAHNTQQAFDYLLDAYYRIGYCDGLTSCPSGNSSEKALEEQSTEFSRRGSQNKRTRDAEKTKKEVIAYLTADPDKKNWKSYHEAIDDIIPMLIQKSSELEGSESSFKVDKNTIKNNLMKWFRATGDVSDSNKKYQQAIKIIFPEKSK